MPLYQQMLQCKTSLTCFSCVVTKHTMTTHLIDFDSFEHFIISFVISDIIWCLLIFILYHVLLYRNQTFIACIVLCILSLLAFPVTILWLIFHSILQINSCNAVSLSHHGILIHKSLPT